MAINFIYELIFQYKNFHYQNFSKRNVRFSWRNDSMSSSAHINEMQSMSFLYKNKIIINLITRFDLKY